MFTNFLLLPYLLLLSSPSLVFAQQNVLTNGNSQLPACAQNCPLLQQANTACASTGTPQAAWTCFCQSAYLTNLYNTAVGICDSVCTDATQNAQVSTWYKSNCGTDNGVKEQAGDTQIAAATTAAAATTTATTNNAAAAAATPTPTSGSGSGSTSSASSSSSSSSSGESWWSGHYKYIIMVIVLAVGFSLLAWLLTWLKRRHERKQDRIPSGGFNAGITERSPPMEHKNLSSTVVPLHGGGGRSDSPARTREAFMPYGYGYARSETRVGSSRGGSPLVGSVGGEGQNGEMGPWPVESSSSTSRGAR